MCTVLLPPCDSPIAVIKYVNINNNVNININIYLLGGRSETAWKVPINPQFIGLKPAMSLRSVQTFLVHFLAYFSKSYQLRNATLHVLKC